ncbi:hypothetical protein Cni_G29531 [Canna indica]|uniref:DDE Tnp4 domain-containing protein n=1 Tax=Canna indica TaxID=4628 RepID=A0AAQ3L5M3_9LILI|nr:hypothetical protein Cni_G29531 [Canna indica]
MNHPPNTSHESDSDEEQYCDDVILVIMLDIMESLDNQLNAPPRRAVRTSMLRGADYVQELIHSSIRCYENLRMEPSLFLRLCGELRRLGLEDKNIYVEESVAYNMQFTYVKAGWEGTANDSWIFAHTIYSPNTDFPMPNGVIDEYYFVDARYPNIPGFLAPYRGERYHQSNYHSRGPTSKRELFNQRHSCCWNVIERCFGLVKARFPILKMMPNYGVSRQGSIVLACCAIHNFIIKYKNFDELVEIWNNEEVIIDDDNEPTSSICEPSSSQNVMHGIREGIANQLWAHRR